MLLRDACDSLEKHRSLVMLGFPSSESLVLLVESGRQFEIAGEALYMYVDLTVGL